MSGLICDPLSTMSMKSPICILGEPNEELMVKAVRLNEAEISLRGCVVLGVRPKVGF
jgi:hypothetical protein